VGSSRITWVDGWIVRQSAPALGPGGAQWGLLTDVFRKLRVATVPPSRQCPTDPAALSADTFVEGTVLTCPRRGRVRILDSRTILVPDSTSMVRS
jgi:hypothetical protein